MKPTFMLRSFLALAGSSIFAVCSASAATLDWDSDTGTSGIQEAGGTFSWAPADVKFWNGSTNVATTNNTTTDIAQFGNGGTLGSVATVNVSTQSINGLIFGATTTNGYTLTASSAQALTLGGSGITVNTGAQATTVGSANLGLTLGAAQSWTNNSSSLLTIGGAVTNGGNLLTIGGTGNTTVSSAIGGTGGLTMSGTGTLALTGANTYTGTTTITGGTLSMTGVSGYKTTALSVASGSTLGINMTGAATSALANTAGTWQAFNTVNAAITGAGVVALNGTNFMIAGGNGSSSMTTNLSAGGVLDVQTGSWSWGYGKGSALTNLGSLNVASGAEYRNSDGAIQFDALTGAGTVGNAYNGAVTLTLGVNNTTNNATYGVAGNVATFSGTIKGGGGVDTYTGVSTGALSLVKTGTGTQILSGTNTYTGATTVNAGILQAGAAAGGQAFGNGSAVTVANVAGAALDLNGFNQTIGSLAGGGTTGGNVTLGNNATLTAGGNNTNTSYAGLISGTGTSGLTKTGSGTLTFSSLTANTYSGGTTVNAGILSLGTGGTSANTSSVGALGTNTVTLNTGGQVRLWIKNNASFTIANNFTMNGGVLHSEDGNYNMTGAFSVPVTSTFSAKYSGKDLTISGAISGVGGVTINNVAGNSGGAVIFSNTGNSYAGATTISVSTLQISTTANGGVNSTLGASSNAAANLVLNGGILRYAGTAAGSTDRLFTLNTTGGTIQSTSATAANSFSLTNTGAIAFGGSGTRTLTLGGANTGNNVFGAVLGDSGGATTLQKSDAGTWSITGTGNTFTGTITLSATTASAGILAYASAGGANAINFSGITTGSATLSYIGFTDKTMSGAITANALTSGTITLGASGTGAVNYSNTGSLGSAGSGNRNLILSGTNTGINILAGQWVNNTGGAATLTKSGTGTWSLTNASNSYTGGTTVSGGILRFVSGALGASGTINATGGTLQWASGNTQDLSTRLATTAAGITTLDTNGNNVTFANALGTANTGLLVKTGAGTLTLQATNNYTGTTTVNAGTLSLDYTTVASKLADGAALILSGGTLDMKNGASSHTEIVASTTLTALTGSYLTQSSGSSVLQMNTITNNTGTVNFGAENIATTDNLNSATTGIIGTWATVGGDWAINSGSTTSGGATVPGTGVADGFIRAYTAYTDLSRLSSGTKAISDGTTTNVRIVDGTGSTGDNTVTGTIAINTLNQSATGGTSTISMANQTLRTDGILMGSGVGALTIGAAGGTAALSGTLTPTTASGTIFVTNNSSNTLTINSVIADNGAGSKLVKTGTGVLVLNGLSTYLGGTTLQDGTIRVGATVGSSGTNGILGGVFNTGLTIANKSTAVFDINGQTAYIKDLKGGGSLGGNVTLGSGTLYIVNPSGGSSYDGTISGMGNVTVSGSSGWNTTGNHTYTGITSIVGTASFNVSTLADGGIASGIGQSSNAAANLVFTGGGALIYNSTVSATTDRRFTLGGNGGFSVSNTGAITWTSTAAITHSNVAAKTLFLGATNTGIGTLAAGITDSGTGANITGITKTGTGAWALTGTGSTFTGAITLNTTTTSAGTLSYASAGGANAITFNQTTSTATLSYTGSGQTMSGLIQANALTTGGAITLDASGTGAINYSNTASLGTGGASGTKGLVVSGTNTGNNTLAGKWENNSAGGAATLTKNGTGKWILSGDNTYTGATNINAGSLIINGNSSTATGIVTVAAAGTIGGIGTVGGATTLNGTLSPGQSPGTLTFSNNLTVNNGSTYYYEGGDLTDVNGTLDLNDNWILSLGINMQDGGSVVLFEYTTLAATPDLVPTFNVSGLGFTPSGGLTLTDTGTTIVLNGVSVIPEPGAVFLGSLGMLLLLRRRR